MLATCLLLMYLSALSYGDYSFPSEHLSEVLSKPKIQKNMKTYHYTRKMQPYQVHYETRIQKVPYRRPYTVYVPKPYLVEVPKPVPYVKLPAPQQYHFEKQPLYSYKIEKPLHHIATNLPVYLEHKLPSSLDSNVPLGVKIPIENPVSVTVEKPLVFPVNLGVEKPIEEKPSEESIEGYLSVPHEAASQFEISVKKEKDVFPKFGKELIAGQGKGSNTFSRDGLSVDLLSQGKQKLFSIPSELSPENKMILESILVSEEPQKWSNFNASEWVPRYEISDIKTVSTAPYAVKPDKQKFEIREEKIPFQKPWIQNLSENQHPEKFSFVPSPTSETITSQKKTPFLQKVQMEDSLKQPLEFPNGKSYQLYNIESEEIIKPEPLTSSFGYKKVEPDQKVAVEPSTKWVANNVQLTAHKELPQHWVNINDHHSTQSDPNKQSFFSQEQYTVQKEPIRELMKNVGEHLTSNTPTKTWLKHNEYTMPKGADQQWVIPQGQIIVQKTSPTQGVDSLDHSTTQVELNKNWMKGQEQFAIQNESSSKWAKGQEIYTFPNEASIKSGNNHEEYTSRKEPDSKWLNSQDQYITQKLTQPQIHSREEQNLKSKVKEQPANLAAHSTQRFSMFPQQKYYAEDAISPQLSQAKEYQKEKNYNHFSQAQENDFKPLIPEQNHVRQSISNSPQNQKFNQQISSQPWEYFERQEPQKQQKHFYNSQAYPIHVLQEHQEERPFRSKQMPDHQTNHQSQDYQVQHEHQQPTSHSSYQQFFAVQDSVPKTQEEPHHLEEAHPQPNYQQNSPVPQPYWHQSSELVFQPKLPESKYTDGSGVVEGYENREKELHQESHIFGQKRRQRQPQRGEMRIEEQVTRSTGVTATASTTGEPTTTTAPSTSSLPRRKLRRKHKRRNQEATTSLPEQ